MQIQYNSDEIVALDARKLTLRTALKKCPDQIGPTATLWREEGLEPSFFDAEYIIQLRTQMALLEYADALRREQQFARRDSKSTRTFSHRVFARING